MRFSQGIAALAIIVSACELPTTVRTFPFGFTRSSAHTQLQLERRFRTFPDRSQIRTAHRELTRLPHPAGSVRDRELADWTARQFSSAGMQDVVVSTHEVLLPRPLEVSVEMTHPRPWRASSREDPVGDPDTDVDPNLVGLPHHAYTASGEISSPVIFAGSGLPRDYDWLSANGVDVRGKIVLVRYSRPYSYRGFKAYVAEQRGAAGILMYSDPADDGSAKGKVYPEGPWAPDSRIERGGIVYDFLVPGDPLTPGWPSIPGGRRINRSAAVSLPKIISVPLSAKDARPILEALEGPRAPANWQGALPLAYRVGAGPARVRMNVRMDDAIRPVWTVTGMFRGDKYPDELVIVGNHRDAWVYGAVDPSGGSAALIELARALGLLTKNGWRPSRSILFASWDAEEFALTSSTEWGEQHETWLRDRAVAYLNVDAGASGSKFVAAAVPSLSRFLSEVAQAVNDPVLRVPVSTVLRDRARAQGGPATEGPGAPVIDDRLGGGSDYAVFLNFLGIPVGDLAFDGPYGVYHSVYDTHQFVSQIADPGFQYHAALVQLWGLATLRLAQADALPLDPDASASRILDYVQEVRNRLPDAAGAAALADVRDAAMRLKAATSAFNGARHAALEAGDVAALTTMNAQIRRFERTFVDLEGLPGRPWYRHVIYAPQFSYEPQTLPGLHDAIESGDHRRLSHQADRLVAALRRAASLLGAK